MADISDTLAAIDSAINNACGCGCGRRLDPDGPSLHFATPECQRSWHEDRTDNPGEVYRRADPVPGITDRFSDRGRQFRPPTLTTIRWLSLWGFEPHAIQVPDGWPSGGAEVFFRDLLSYRRHCDTCGRREIPQNGSYQTEEGDSNVPDVRGLTWYGVTRRTGRPANPVVQRCRRCQTTYDGPTLTGRAVVTYDEIQLTLTDGSHRVDDFIAYADMVNGPHLWRETQRLWAALEARLTLGEQPPGLAFL